MTFLFIQFLPTGSMEEPNILMITYQIEFQRLKKELCKQPHTDFLYHWSGFMDEYSRIVIENYCFSHDTQKSKFLNKMVKISYTAKIPSDADMNRLSRYIEHEDDEALLEALKDLDAFLCL